MQGDFEVRPLTTCEQCGARVARPLGPSFVYGIGPIGFQHCGACGARWRCLWPAAPPPRHLSVRAAVLVVAVALALAAGVAAYATTRTGSGPELASATRGSRSPASGPSRPETPRRRYLTIVGPVNGARSELRQFLDAAPPITPRAELDRHAAAFAAVARGADGRLGDARWPAAVQGVVQDLIAADREFTADLQSGVGKVNQPSFRTEIAADATALQIAAGRVRARLGLAAAPAEPDPRFPSI